MYESQLNLTQILQMVKQYCILTAGTILSLGSTQANKSRQQGIQTCEDFIKYKLQNKQSIFLQNSCAELGVKHLH